MNRSRSTYAVVIDIDNNLLSEVYGPNNTVLDRVMSAYKEIRDFMLTNGFVRAQGGANSVYFGGDGTDAVKCTLAIQRLAQQCPWFSTCVKDIRMLRIEENNDLLPAIQ